MLASQLLTDFTNKNIMESKKTYFCKYLPVEGEVEIGDLFFSFSGKVVECLDNEGDILYGPMNGFLKTNIGNKKSRRAKLFLCTTDIQVGDKCFCLSVEEGNKQNPDMWIDPYRVRSQGDTCTTCIKVIGEISPEAIWVKEGDEFIAEGPDCEVFPYHNHSEDGSIIYLNKYDEPVEIPIYTIKCSTCKKFY